MIRITSLPDAEDHLSGIEAVIFDLDDTLYSEKDYVRSGFRAAAALFPAEKGMAEELWDAFEAGKPAIDAVLAARGLTERKSEALQAYRSHTPALRLYPGAGELLRRLRRSRKLGIITDGRPEGQRAKLAVLGLSSLVDEIIITDELGGPEWRKPNAEAFRLMSRRLEVPFERMAYVGDNTAKDFVAPEKLGMRSIWFDNPDGLYSGK